MRKYIEKLGWVAIAACLYSYVLVPLVFKDDTTWAKNFNEKEFDDLHCGMTSAEVKSKLGEPIQSWKSGELLVWDYATSQNDSNHEIRRVLFSKDDALHKIMDGYHVD